MVLAAVYGEWAQQLMESKCINYDVALQPRAHRPVVGGSGRRAEARIEAPRDQHQLPTAAIAPENMNSVDINAIRATKGWKLAV
ncbi:MAG: hypothetical protein JWP76_4401 [Dactylosporangium sp.]|nr:hypothetical protein [Dactylosporangium sp.]